MSHECPRCGYELVGSFVVYGAGIVEGVIGLHREHLAALEQLRRALQAKRKKRVDGVRRVTTTDAVRWIIERSLDKYANPDVTPAPTARRRDIAGVPL